MGKVKNKFLIILSVILCMILLSMVVIFALPKNDTNLSVNADTIDSSKYTRGSGLYQYNSSGTLTNFVPASSYLTVDSYYEGKVLRVNTPYLSYAGEVYLDDIDMSGITNLSSMFYMCENLTSIIFGKNFDSSNVVEVNFMFDYCSKLTNLDISNLNTSSVKNMSCMFFYCTSLTSLDVSNFDTSNVTDMVGMFTGFRSLASLDLTNFNTRSVTDMTGMFQDSDGLENIKLSNFDTSNVKSFNSMFKDCENLTNIDVSHFNTANATDFSAMFGNCNNLTSLDLSNFVTSNATKMNSMFNYCKNLTQLNISNFDTSNVTEIAYMFYNCEKLINLDIGNFNTEKVTKMTGMFKNCIAIINLNLDNFNTNNVIDMSEMFLSCESLTNLDLSYFNTQNVTNMSKMFAFCNGLTNLNINNFDTTNVTNMSHMFISCKGLTDLNITNFDTSKVTNMSSMFSTCRKLTNINLNNFNTQNVTNMLSMFEDCDSLTELNISNFITTSVTNMSRMFASDYELISLDLSNFDTKNVTNMNSMFRSCTKLNSLNVRSFNTQNVLDMSLMFDNCISLTELDVGNFTTTNVTDMSGMFSTCSNLLSLNLSNFDTNNVTNMTNMFAYCSSLNNLDLSNFDTSKVTTMYHTFYACSNLENLDISNFNMTNVASDGVYTCADMLSYSTSLRTVKTPKINPHENIIAITKMYDADKEYQRVTYLPVTTGTSHTLVVNSPVTGFPNTWQDEISNSTYMTRPINATTITSIIFDFTAPSGYGKIGELSSGLEVYAKGTDIAFVSAGTIMAPSSSAYLFSDANNKKIYLTNLTSITFTNFDTSNIENAVHMFMGCSNLTNLDLSNFNTTNITNMSCMFKDCSNLTDLNVSSFNTAKVTDLSGMFEGTSLVSLDLSNFDTSNVIYMDSMFYGCENLSSVNLSGFNTSKVRTMGWMFGHCGNIKELDLSNFNTTQVVDMGHMFYYCSNLQSLNISSFDMTNATDTDAMISCCYILNKINTPKINNKTILLQEVTGNTWYDETDDKSDLVILPTTNGTSHTLITKALKYTITYCSNDGLGTQIVQEVTYGEPFTTKAGDIFTRANYKMVGWTYNDNIFDVNTEYIYEYAFNIQLLAEWALNDGVFPNAWQDEVEAMNISGISKTKDITEIMFEYSRPSEFTNYAGTLSTGIEVYYTGTRIAFVYGDVIYADWKIQFCYYEKNAYGINTAVSTSLQKITFNNFNTSNSTDLGGLFIKCDKLTELNLSSFDTSNCTLLNAMFNYCSSLVSVNLSSFRTPKTYHFSYMFANCPKLESLDISNFDFTNATFMNSMFAGDSSLVNLNIGTPNTSNVQDMSSMFSGCSKLTDLDLSSFDTSNVTTMDYMFQTCTKLSTLDISSFNMTNVTSSQYMFNNCNSLKLLKTPKINSNSSIILPSTLCYSWRDADDNDNVVTYLPVTNGSSHTLNRKGTIFTITYNPNGGEGNTFVENIAYGDLFTTKPSDFYTKSGYEIANWSTNALTTIGNFQIPNKEYTYDVMENITLYARWITKSYTVTYMSNDGNNNSVTDTVRYGEVFRTKPSTTFTKQYYYISNWSTDPQTLLGGYQRVDAQYTYSGNADLTLYAIWSPNHSTIRLGNLENIEKIEYSTSLDGEYFLLTTTGFVGDANQNYYFRATPITAQGYVITFKEFNGWFTDLSNPSGAHSFTANGDTYLVNAVATRDADYVIVNFDANGGELEQSSLNVIYSLPYGNLPSPTKDDYTFAGWFTSLQNGDEITEDTIVTNHDEHTLYAKWKVNIEFITENDSIYSQSSYFENTQYGMPANPVLDGYNFVGWTSDFESALQEWSSGTKVCTIPTKWYAVWTKTETDVVTQTLTHTFNYGEIVTENTNITQNISGREINYNFDLTISEIINEGTVNTVYGQLPYKIVSKAGYEFVGWTTNDLGISAEWESEDGAIVPQESCNFYAVWRKTVTLTIKYSLKIGTIPESISKSVTQYFNYDLTNYTQNKITMELAPKVEVKDYNFKNWNTEEVGNGQKYYASQSYDFVITDDTELVLYGQMKKQYTLLYILISLIAVLVTAITILIIIKVRKKQKRKEKFDRIIFPPNAKI